MTTHPTFGVAVLTHGRPTRIKTIRTLRKHGYTGPIHLILDDDDPTLPEYQKHHAKSRIHTFSKTEWATRFDLADTTNDTRAVIYARNAATPIMRELGYTHYIQLDDDYTGFEYRWLNTNGTLGWQPIRDLDTIFNALTNLLQDTRALTVATSQGGDHIGGRDGRIAKHHVLRKAMNSFVIDTTNPPTFVGRINEDVNTYVTLGTRGNLLFTTMSINLVQTRTQSQPGGMTGIYETSGGTYAKSFYTLMMAPSCVKIGRMGETERRYHHHIIWDHAVPKILPAHHRKPATP